MHSILLHNDNIALLAVSNGTFVLQDVIGVILGGTLGHALCTGLAVIGGRFVAQRISMRTGSC